MNESENKKSRGFVPEVKPLEKRSKIEYDDDN